jgi:hypothetical protein
VPEPRLQRHRVREVALLVQLEEPAVHFGDDVDEGADEAGAGAEEGGEEEVGAAREDGEFGAREGGGEALEFAWTRGVSSSGGGWYA